MTVRRLPSVLCPLSSVRCPLSSVLCPLSSVLCPLSSAGRRLAARIGAGAADPVRGHNALIDAPQELSARAKRCPVPRRQKGRDLQFDGFFVPWRLDRFWITGRFERP